VVEHLPSKYKALNSNPSTTQNKNKNLTLRIDPFLDYNLCQNKIYCEALLEISKNHNFKLF
jgi:hypothetical protein